MFPESQKEWEQMSDSDRRKWERAIDRKAKRSRNVFHFYKSANLMKFQEIVSWRPEALKVKIGSEGKKVTWIQSEEFPVHLANKKTKLALVKSLNDNHTLDSLIRITATNIDSTMKEYRRRQFEERVLKQLQEANEETQNLKRKIDEEREASRRAEQEKRARMKKPEEPVLTHELSDFDKLFHAETIYNDVIDIFNRY